MAAKEVDIKKVELKVSVNCCDGCKRKVKKLLQSIEGVLKTEVDNSLPKVTVLGNVEAKVLIKKLAKAGKQAEVWATAANDQNKLEKGKKEEEQGKGSDKEIKVKADESCEKKFSNTCEQSKCTSSSSSSSSDKKKTAGHHLVNAKEDISKEKVESTRDGSSPQPRVIQIDNSPPLPHHHVIQAESSNCSIQPDAGNGMPLAAQYCYIVEHPKVPLSHCAVASLVAPPLSYYGQDRLYLYGSPITNQALLQLQPPVSRVGDYFSDENTMGCHVM